MSSSIRSVCGRGSLILAVAAILASSRPALADTAVNLTGTWVGNGGSETKFTHNGSSLKGTSWGGPANSTLTGSMTLTGGDGRPVIYRGTYEGRQGNLRGSGTITITIYDQDKIFVRYTGIVTDGKQTTSIDESGFAHRK